MLSLPTVEYIRKAQSSLNFEAITSYRILADFNAIPFLIL